MNDGMSIKPVSRLSIFRRSISSIVPIQPVSTLQLHSLTLFFVLNSPKAAKMRVFVTGASVYMGSAIVPQLISAGHHVIGRARSDASAKSLEAAGAEVHRSDLEDLQSLKAGAAKADGVIRLAFIPDFSKYGSESSEQASRAPSNLHQKSRNFFHPLSSSMRQLTSAKSLT
jgi:D-arabinose 1-dehydrogenase-like Zn-dependent alcohol dehydrogenase